MRTQSWTSIIVASLATTGIAAAGYLIDLDYASFRGQDSLCFVEVYAAIQQAAFQSSAADSTPPEFSVVLDVLDSNGVAISDTFTGHLDQRPGEAKEGGAFFPRVFRFFMKPGRYQARATIHDSEWREREQVIIPMEAKAFNPDGMQVSDIETACRMEFDAEPSAFVKSSVLALPNATGFFGAELPMVYYYAEAYGLAHDSSRVDSYAVVRRILQADNLRQVRPPTSRVYRTPGPDVVIADGFPVATFRTGTYILELEVQDFRSGNVANQRKKFWTFREGDFSPTSSPDLTGDLTGRLLESDPSILDIIEPDSALQLMKYVMSREETKRVKRLTPEGRREYLLQYWHDRETLEPDAADKYFARVSEANERFSILHRPGWKTDRGRIFILYGEPTNITRNTMQSKDVNSEIWEYDRLEGGVYFAFADYNEYGDYELVHSTMRGELSNPNWEQTLSTGRRTSPSAIEMDH